MVTKSRSVAVSNVADNARQRLLAAPYVLILVVSCTITQDRRQQASTPRGLVLPPGVSVEYTRRPIVRHTLYILGLACGL